MHGSEMATIMCTSFAKAHGIVLFLILNGVILFSCTNGQMEGEIRLSEQNKGRGRVEIFHDNKWGTICNDYWDMDDATVVCRALDFPTAVRVYNLSSGNTDKPIWLDNVRCDGFEANLTDCAHNGWGTSNCLSDHSEDAAVECQTYPFDGDVCLGRTSEKVLHESAGHLEIYWEGKWIKVSDSDWGVTESTVVCRQLGLIAATHFSVLSECKSHNVKCHGTEQRLEDCDHGSWHDECEENGVEITCSTSIPDSAVDALYNPEKYCWTSFSTGSADLLDKQATLDVIRDIFDVCVGVVPAEIKCIDVAEDPNKPIYDNSTKCNRRLGFTCNDILNPHCQSYNVSVRCPCENELDTPTLCFHGDLEYSAGETRPDVEDCRACTCSSEALWLCDSNEKFCKKAGPPPFEATCYRPNGCEDPPEYRNCILEDWIVEWFIGGSSPYCDSCLFPYEDVDDTYVKGFQPKICPECIPLDGITRAVAVVNRQLPGPDVQVCEGDTIFVKVVNKMAKEPSASTTIHWHGMFMKGTQYMDGAFMVTQCPIPFGEAFLYNFTAIPHGTHWWHSHAGLQRGDGVAGALIVRQPKNKDVNGDQYDFDRPEHVVVLQDWAHQVGVNHFTRDFYQEADFQPGSILINGKGGQNIPKEDRPRWCGKNDTALIPCPVPRYEQFNITSGNRFRFRVISTSVARDCGMRVSVDNHDLTIIATDGAPTEPFTCKAFVAFSAERYDFVLKADQEPGNYWMRVRGLHSCGHLNAFAIVHYESSELTLPESKDDSIQGIVVDPCDNFGDFAEESKYLHQLNSNAPAPDWTESQVDKTFYIGLVFGDDNVKFLPKVNNITFRLPSRPFLLDAESPQEKLEVCNLENHVNGQHYMEVCGNGYCECSHVINIPYDEVVEIFFVNMNLSYANFSACHPMHLHGFNYRVVAEERFPSNIVSSVEYVKSLNEQGKINRKPVARAIQKDTMVAPVNGFTAVQFRANNYGYWFLHCHFEIHLALGMVLVLKVGERENFPVRPNSSPSCGDWPVPRSNDGEAFTWSEIELGNINAIQSPLLKAVNETIEQSRFALQGTFNRQFKEYEVTNNRLKTDPIAGFHYYLFKINTGDEWYIHIQLKASTNEAQSQKPKITACQDSLNADSPLLPIKVNSPKNLCRPPVSRVVCSSAAPLYDTSQLFSAIFYFSIAVINFLIVSQT